MKNLDREKRKLSDGRIVFYDKVSGKYYDPVTDIFLNPDEVVKYGLMEKAPPSDTAERFIKNNKKAFKKRYGDEWEPILYATAWKKFGNKNNVYESAADMDEVRGLRKKGFSVYVSKVNKNDTVYEVEKGNKEMTIIYHKNDDKFHIYDKSRSRYKHNDLTSAIAREFPQELKEHSNPDYLDKWKDQGFNIGMVEDDEGITFVVAKGESEIEIHEPETGTYKTDGKTFDSFDDAMSHQLKSTFADINLNEESDIKSIMKKINESFFSVSPEEQEAIEKAYKLGKETKYSNIQKGRSHEDDAILELIQDFPEIRKKLVAYFTKGVKDKGE